MQNINSPLFEICNQMSYLVQRKQNQIFFYDNLISKIGKNSINKRVVEIFKKIQFVWTYHNSDQNRVQLKQTFF